MRSAVLLLPLCWLAGCADRVQHGLDEAQANEIEALLLESGFSAEKVAEGGKDARWSIEVPDDQASAAVRTLQDHGLPREAPAGFGEVFGKGSMVPTATEERALFLHAQAGELMRTLEQIQGVVRARAHIVPASGQLPRPGLAAEKPRAAVLLKVRHGSAEQVAQAKPAIQQLVAGSVEGLEAEHVAIVISELSAPPPVQRRSPTRAIRFAAIGCASLVVLLALGLAFFAVRTRSYRLALEENRQKPAPAERRAAPAKTAVRSQPTASA